MSPPGASPSPSRGLLPALLLSLALLGGIAAEAGAQARQITLAVASAGAAEGDSGHKDVDITVTIPSSSAAEAGIVAYSLCFGGSATLDTDGTKDAGEDYRLVNFLGEAFTGLVWSNGCLQDSAVQDSTVTRSIRVFGDRTREPDETITVTLGERDRSSPLHNIPLPSDLTISPTNNPFTYTVRNDEVGISLSRSAVTLDELDAAGAAGTDTYTVVLDTDPGAGVTVVVSVSPDNVHVVRLVGDGPVFTGGSAGNWATPQTVTFRAVNDGDVADDSVTITHRSVVDQGSTNPYHQLDGPDVTATVNDAGHGVIASPSALDVRGNDGTADYTLRLKSAPGGTVTVTPTSGTPAHATVSGAVSFDDTDWRTPKTVTVTGKGDTGDTATITHAITTGVTGTYPTSLSGLPAVAVTVNTPPC